MSQTAIKWEVEGGEEIPQLQGGRMVFAEGGFQRGSVTLPGQRLAFVNPKPQPLESLGEHTNRIGRIEESFVSFAETADAVRFPPVVFVPVVPVGHERFIVLQSWEGYVLSVSVDSFVARLVDSKHIRPDEEAEFDVNELTEDDREMLEPGAVFYWSIGYYDKPSGQRIRASEIRFRRLPAWTKEELKEAREHAKRLSEQLGW